MRRAKLNSILLSWSKRWRKARHLIRAGKKTPLGKMKTAIVEGKISTPEAEGKINMPAHKGN